MIKLEFFSRLLLLLLLALLQVFLFNNINFLQLAIPFVYVLFVLSFPIQTNQYALLFWAFAMGILIDFFDSTLGVHSFSLVFMAYSKTWVLKLLSYNYAKEPENFEFHDLAKWQTFLYFFILIILHHCCVFLFYDLNFNQPIVLIKRIILSSLLTFVFVVLYDYLKPNKKE